MIVIFAFSGCHKPVTFTQNVIFSYAWPYQIHPYILLIFRYLDRVLKEALSVDNVTLL